MLVRKSLFHLSLIILLFSPHTELFADSRQALYLNVFVRVNVDQTHEQIFRQVLSLELGKQVTVIEEGYSAGSPSGSDARTVNGSLSALGDKIIVMMKVHDVEGGKLVFSERVNATSINELDIIAERLAQSYFREQDFDQSVTVNNVIGQEAAAKPLKSMMQGSVLQFVSFDPLGSKNYGTGRQGVGFLYGGINEEENFFVKSSFGIRLGNYNDYLEVPVDIAVGKFFRNTGMTPFVSGGLGLRYMKEELTINRVSSGAIVRTVNQSLEEEEVGIAAHAELGVVFLRQYTYRLVTSLRYDVSNTDPFERGNYESISLQLGVKAF